MRRVCNRSSVQSWPEDGMRRATFLCEKEGDVQGSGSYYMNYNTCHVYYFQASPVSRGFGSELWPISERDIVENTPCRELSLIPDDLRARNFWEKMGFRCSKTYDDPYFKRSRCVEMKKNIGP